MTRIWKILGMHGLLAAALATSPVLADDKDGQQEPSSAKAADAEEVLKELRKIREEIGTAKKALEQRLDETDKSLKTQIENLSKATDLKIQKLQGDINGLQTDLSNTNRELTQLRQELENLRTKELASLRQELDRMRGRSAFYEAQSPERAPAPAAQPPAGRVQLVNAYPEPMTVLLNARAYQLMPGETRTVSVPAGNFTFQVMRVHTDLQPRTLAANQTYTITVHPQ